MRLNEFYNPEDDNFTKRSPGDTRKAKLTLEELQKLRKVRDMKNGEDIEHEKFVRVMYSQPAQGDTL
jgi:hypothetical protein|tara:strand:- start:1763 stop:1963 length:201 start_codon:yes stop_codon:yes gene_type:complete